MSEPTRDLIVLVADGHQRATIDALLGKRCPALGIRPPSYEVVPHPLKDPGCRTNAAEFLRIYARRTRHAIVVFDREGSGGESSPADELERVLESDLARNGWGERARAVVIDPEIEAWVWSESPEVDRIVGWQGRIPALRSWLLDEAFLGQGEVKPGRPKEALRAALREVRKQPSSALFRQLAETVGVKSCTDRAFVRLRQCLVEWFPNNP